MSGSGQGIAAPILGADFLLKELTGREGRDLRGGNFSSFGPFWDCDLPELYDRGVQKTQSQPM